MPTLRELGNIFSFYPDLPSYALPPELPPGVNPGAYMPQQLPPIGGTLGVNLGDLGNLNLRYSRDLAYPFQSMGFTYRRQF